MHPKVLRLSVVLSLTTIFFFVEIIVGFVTNSLALVADAFHMLSDIIALVIAIWAITAANSNKVHEKRTYGWARAEVLGALINGIILLTLCFSIALSAIERYISIEEIKDPVLLLVVGGLGLLINLIGLAILWKDGGGHGHSHGGGGCGPAETETASGVRVHSLQGSDNRDHGHSHGQSNSAINFTHHERDGHNQDEQAQSFSRVSAPTTVLNRALPAVEDDHAELEVGGGHMNMRGAFLHVLGDALGSVAVIISALVVYLSEWSGKDYVDPTLSLVILFILLVPTVPLVLRAARVLLLFVPPSVDLVGLQRALEQTESVVDVHDLHIWQLDDNKFIGSAHVMIADASTVSSAMLQVKRVLHGYGVHSSSIQPEIQDFLGVTRVDGSKKDDEQCLLQCESVKCAPLQCCKQRKVVKSKNVEESRWESVEMSDV